MSARPAMTPPAAKVVAPAAFAPAAGDNPAATLLRLESQARETKSLAELQYFIANEARTVARAQQIWVLSRAATGRMTVRAVTAQSQVDRQSPLVMWIEGVARWLETGHGLAQAREFDASAPGELPGLGGDEYPLRALLWLPLADPSGTVFAGLLLARAAPWLDSEVVVARHLAGACAHTWLAHEHRPSARVWKAVIPTRTVTLALAVALALVAIAPVSMSALAPVEVVPRDPVVVTAGVEGVVGSVLVKPNQPVKTGDTLVRMTDTVLRNRLELAEQDMLVAEARHKKAAQLAFVDIRGRHELAVAQAELELKIAERNYARDLLARTEIKADRDGIALFADPRDLVGRPVAVGERLMEIADPAKTEFRIELPAADAIVLRERARVTVYLDSAPLSPIAARLVRADYQARMRDSQVLSFRLVAEATAGTSPIRPGVRGTAQVFSDRVPLAYYLLRRPIAAARQWVGL